MFAHPEWFLLLPVLALIAWQARWLRLEKPLRIATLLLLTLVLVDMRFRTFEDGLDLWVLVDRSASAEDLVGPRLAEWEGLLRRSQRENDRMRRVDFARFAQEATEGGEAFADPRDQTNLADALQLALNRRTEDRLTRVLILSDGYPTQPLDHVATAFREAAIPVDYRLTAYRDERDLAVERLDLPPQVQTGEPFLIEATVTGAPGAEAAYALHRNGETIAQGTVALPGGQARLRLSTKPPQAGAFAFELVIDPTNDPRPGNNRMTRWLEVRGGPRILLITRYAEDPVAGLLQRAGAEVVSLNQPRRFHEGLLSGARLIVLNDVPANEFPSGSLAALDYYVRGQGGALLMLGGKFSFGSGGYFESPLEAIMPVSVDLKDEHRRLVTAMAIVMDRSGSMGMGVGGGRTKMDLANSGAAESTRLLGDSDLLAVYAVDSEPEEIIPLVNLRGHRNQIEDRVRRIGAGGGGIFVYNGLAAAWKTLKNVNVGQRHILLFADAADAEQPDAYRALLAEMQTAGATVSVIGLGSRSDADAVFLEDIAARGSGRAFFAQDASELPSLFAQETVAVARSTFLEEPVSVEGTAGWLELAATPLPWLGSVDGYNLTYLKEGATIAAFAQDEYQAPLVAFWNKGAGRVAAVTFPVTGPFSERFRAWPQSGDFVQTLCRWLAGEATPDGLGLRTRLDGDRLRVELYYDASWSTKLAEALPTLHYTATGTDDLQTATWERMEPGRLRADITLPAELPVRGAAQFGEHVLSFGPVAVGADLEWRIRPEARQALAGLAQATGGTERLNFATAWESPPTQRRQSIRWWLLLAALALFLGDVAATRLGLKVALPWRILERLAPGR